MFLSIFAASNQSTMLKPAVSPEKAVSLIQSGDHIYIQAAAAAPVHLVQALTKRHTELRDVQVYHMHTEGPADYALPQYAESFQVNAFFIGGNIRQAIQSGYSQYIPVFLSEIPLMFRRNILPIDVALIQVSPPDHHGFCSLGVSVEACHAAIEKARLVIAQVNKKMPRSHGDGLVHVSRFDAYCEVDEFLPAHDLGTPDEIETRIGQHVASLVEDGATLQMGIGGIPNAALLFLGNHKNLGIHTEMFSDGILPLVEKGVINGLNKKIHPGRIVSTFAMGTQKLYDFIHDNPQVAMLDVQYVNDTAVIRRNPKVTAINSAIEIDITGQVCADSIGYKMYSGVGGQMDFIRGASLSEGGRPIIALPSQTLKGVSKIVPALKEGAGVVTTRAHVHHVVTEFGVVDLYGKNLKHRAHALINIAHPDHREMLTEQAWNRFGRW